MVSWLVRSFWIKWSGFEPWPGDTVLCSRHFTQDTLLSQGEWPVTSILSGGSRNTPSHFMLQKLG